MYAHAHGSSGPTTDGEGEGHDHGKRISFHSILWTADVDRLTSEVEELKRQLDAAAAINLTSQQLNAQLTEEMTLLEAPLTEEIRESWSLRDQFAEEKKGQTRAILDDPDYGVPPAIPAAPQPNRTSVKVPINSAIFFFIVPPTGQFFDPAITVQC